MLQTKNPFQTLWDLGYKRLCPIIPPGAPISEKSNLFKRLRNGKDERGKAPGRLRDGLWSGFDFTVFEPDESDLEKWAASGAGVGIKTGQGLVLFDADTINPEWADTIKLTLERNGLILPIRIGRAPKVGYLVRTDVDFPFTMFEFGPRRSDNKRDRVEILTEGKQFVAQGIHPGTMQPYKWPDGVPPLSEVPFASKEKLMAVMEQLSSILPEVGKLEVARGDTGDYPDQETLRMPTDLLTKLVEATPNTTEEFPKRESYLKYGYAIKAAAGPENERLARDLFLDWAARWKDPDGCENDPEEAEADWLRMKPPFRTGKSRILNKAKASPAGLKVLYEQWTEPNWKPVERSSPIFEESPPADQNLSKQLFSILTLDQIANLPPPKFLIDRHVPERSVGFLYGDPGTGKSFIALDWALHIAYGAEKWHGDPIDGTDDGMVIYLAGEGASGMRTRASAWKQRHGHTHDSENFGLLGGTVNFMSKDDGPKLVRSLERHAERFGRPIRMIVVDTVSRAMPGADENSQKEMTLFVRACDLLRDEFGCAVVGVHHANKSGDMRGSTVLLGAGDFVLKLERKKGHAVGYLVCEKQKDAPDGWKDSYRFDVVTVSEKESSLVPMRLNSVDAETVPQGLESAILGALHASWERGEPWGKTPQTKDRWAVRRMVNDFAMDAHDAEMKLAEWLESGTVREDWIDKRDKKKGLIRVDFSEPNVSVGENEEAEQGAFE
jgi:hypothetical protein